MSRVGAVPHSRTKHIDLRHHYVRECVEAGWVSASGLVRANNWRMYSRSHWANRHSDNIAMVARH